MKLITLNTWGGVVHKPLLEFLATNKDLDIFCFQEIFHDTPEEKVKEMTSKVARDLFADIEAVLPDHKGYFRPSLENYYGIAVFVRKDISVKKEGDIPVYSSGDEKRGYHSRNLQYIEIAEGDESLTIAHVHGLWNGNGKTDTESRLEQSKKIKAFMDSVSGPKILCGDFNLLPDTESLKMLEPGLRNLIKDYGITCTRTSFYTRSTDKYADYMLVSPDIKVIDFKVLPDEVSDHSALLLEFEV